MAEPACPYFGKCGGCSLQHVIYEDQLEQKKKTIQSLLHADEVTVLSDTPYAYRNRMDFIFHESGLGLRAKGNWKKIIPIKKCAIAEPKINELLEEINTWFVKKDAFNIFKKSGTYKYGVIRTSTTESSMSFVLNSDSSKLGEAIEDIKAFAKTSKATHIQIAYASKKSDISTSEDIVIIKGNPYLTTKLCDKTFQYHIQGFFQNNYAMTEHMHRFVQQKIQAYSPKNAHLLDLYGGVGTFGILNAEHMQSVTSIESYQGCTDAAKENAQLNNVELTAICKDAKQLSSVSLKQPLVVIADPPRSGMHPTTIGALNRLEPELIIYISCNPRQLAKDIPKFKNYTIKEVALADLFPQTPHTEAIAVLVKI